MPAPTRVFPQKTRCFQKSARTTTTAIIPFAASWQPRTVHVSPWYTLGKFASEGNICLLFLHCFGTLFVAGLRALSLRYRRHRGLRTKRGIAQVTLLVQGYPVPVEHFRGKQSESSIRSRLFIRCWYATQRGIYTINHNPTTLVTGALFLVYSRLCALPGPTVQ